MYQSIFAYLSIPDAVVAALFLGALALIGTAFLPGLEFGGLKLPLRSSAARVNAGFGGAVILLLCVLFSQPFITVAKLGPPIAVFDAKLCTDKLRSVPLLAESLTATGRNHRVDNGYRSVIGIHDSSKCRERYSASWKPAPGHIFLVEDGTSGVATTIVGAKTSESILTIPAYGPGVRFLQSIAVDLVASKNGSRDCGATITLTALHVPEACRSVIAGD